MASNFDQFAPLAKAADANALNALLLLVARESLSGFLLDRIADFLATTVGDTTSFSADWRHFASQLPLQAARETAGFNQSERQFKSLAELLRKYEDQVVWLKGTALSRTVYSRPEFRSSSDFDLIAPLELIQPLCELLIKDGYQRITDSPALCPQLGAGPVLRERDLLLAPTVDLLPVGTFAFKKAMAPIVEIKLDALELGLKANLTHSLFDEALKVEWKGNRFLVPSLIHHTLILCAEFHKDGFSGWRRLLDIHLLCSKIDGLENGWSNLYDLARHDAVTPSLWASLWIARNRLNTSIPDDLLISFRPKSKWFSYTVNPRFVWNSNSLPMLMLNAAISADGRRKWSALNASFHPSDQFMTEYYGSKELFLAHWLVMLLPAGLVRRSFGKFMWGIPTSTKSDQQDSHRSN